MKLHQISLTKIFLAAILLLFIAKGIVLSFLIPIFQNPDEQVHYGTVQHWAEPKEINQAIKRYEKDEYKIDIADIRTSNLPEETRLSAHFGKFNEIISEKQNIQNFSDPGIENEIIGNIWKRYVDTVPSAVSGTKSVYYLLSSLLEEVFSDESIFARIFSMRILAVAFGIGVVALAYLTARKVGLSERVSILLTTLVAFQPMLSITAAQVNIDIALIFSFSLFLYAGVSFLRYVDSCATAKAFGDTRSTTLGMTKWAALAIFAAVLGFFSKGPGIVLIAALFPLFTWGAYRWYVGSQSLDSRLRGNDNEEGSDNKKKSGNDKKKRFFAYLAVATIIMAGLAFFAIPKTYLVGITNFNANSKFSSPLESIGKYLGKTMDMGEFRESSISYWGNFGWLDAPIPGWMLSAINWIEIVGFGVVLMYLLVPILKKKNWIPAFAGMTTRGAGIQRLLSSWIPGQARDDKTGWVPERKYLVFFLGMILALQVAIRFYDWRVFDATGQVLIGQPGRYFLPNLVGHLVIVSVGLGLAVSWVRQFVIPYLSRKISWIPAFAGMTKRNDKTDFEMVMKVLALGMILLQFHAIVNVIIPRYYL
jgi:hypothetical protein